MANNRVHNYFKPRGRGLKSVTRSVQRVNSMAAGPARRAENGGLSFDLCAARASDRMIGLMNGGNLP